MSSPQQLNSRASQTLTLEDGRILGFAEFGSKEGSPIFHLHGLPGSRYEGKLFESAAVETNARIITIDRPGVGLSSPQPARTAPDHAKDVQALAAHLKIDTFSVMGVSGGGPYALACAYAIPPSQLKSVAVVAGVGAYHPDTCKNMGATNRWMVWGLKAAPWASAAFVRVFFGMMLWSSDEALHNKMQESLGGGGWLTPRLDEKDKLALEDGQVNWTLIAEIREHFKQGFATYTDDGKIVAGELGFDMQHVPCEKVALWYGKRDANAPPEIGEDYARRLGRKATFKLLDETHLSLVKNCGGVIIKDLLAS